jgi:hypothetical protein
MIDPSTATAPSDTRAEPTPVAAPRPVKFNYLVAQRFLSREQLAAALAEAKERHQSVESLLIDKYGVRKGDLGTSLSLFYRLQAGQGRGNPLTRTGAAHAHHPGGR